MKSVTADMQNSIPTKFDISTKLSNSSYANNTNSSSNSFNAVDMIVEALRQVKIELDDEQTGKFVRKTIAETIFS